jgi:hypothetical protein
MFTGCCTAVGKPGRKSVSGREIVVTDPTIPSAPVPYPYLPILLNFLSGK